MTESLKNVMCDSYRVRLESQVNGMKNSPFVEMCVTSFRHGIENTLDELEPKQKKLVLNLSWLLTPMLTVLV